ncbi:MAG: tetratricopeptide repeat protein [Bryobacterales bacterium]|nr:tetratricopeptide repeat protein [Bryobacterales bacterium]
MGRHALELGPLDLANNSHQGWHYLWIHRHPRAVEPLKKAIEMDPAFPVAQWYLGLAYEQTGALDSAIEQFQNCVRITRQRPSMVALLGHAYAASGRTVEANAVLKQLGEASQRQYVPPYPIAAIHAALGHTDEAFHWLERAYEGRDSWMSYLGVDSRMDPSRPDPRFAALLRRMNL